MEQHRQHSKAIDLDKLERKPGKAGFANMAHRGERGFTARKGNHTHRGRGGSSRGGYF